jgi:hypothetical protein
MLGFNLFISDVSSGIIDMECEILIGHNGFYYVFDRDEDGTIKVLPVVKTYL